MDAGRLRWVIVLSIVGALGVGACSTDSATPATAPATTATTVLETSTTTTSEAATTTTAAATTTLDRNAEIEAIFQDLEQRRLTALYEGDEEAFKALFANEAYMRRSLGALEVVEFTGPPETAEVSVLAVLHDGKECVAAELRYEAVRELIGATGTVNVAVVERSSSGDWGLSYAGTGWICEGSHPLGQ